jgi:hypothetical protein
MRIALKGRDNDARNCWRILESIGNLLQKMERLQPPAAFNHRESVRAPEARAMPIREKGGGVRNLRMLFNVGTVGSLSDGQLLERFATGVGEARELAFAALVERHGSLVYRVCRAVLGDEHEADDALRPRSSRSPTRPERSGRATLSAPGYIRLPIGRRATIDHPGCAIVHTNGPRPVYGPSALNRATKMTVSSD